MSKTPGQIYLEVVSDPSLNKEQRIVVTFEAQKQFEVAVAQLRSAQRVQLAEMRRAS